MYTVQSMLHRRTKKKRMYQCLFWDIKRPQESSSCFSGLLSGMRVPLELFPPARPPRPLSQSKRASHHRPLPPPSPPTHSPPCSKSSQVEQVGNGGRGAILLAPAPTATATATEAPTPLLAVGRRRKQAAKARKRECECPDRKERLLLLFSRLGRRALPFPLSDYPMDSFPSCSYGQDNGTCASVRSFLLRDRKRSGGAL